MTFTGKIIVTLGVGGAAASISSELLRSIDIYSVEILIYTVLQQLRALIQQ